MKMTFSVFDMLGFDIKEDDYVVGGFLWGRSATTRIGKVLEKKEIKKRTYYGPTDSNYYLKIEWIHGRGLPDKPSLIAVKPGEKSQFLKVDIDGTN